MEKTSGSTLESVIKQAQAVGTAQEQAQAVAKATKQAEKAKLRQELAKVESEVWQAIADNKPTTTLTALNKRRVELVAQVGTTARAKGSLPYILTYKSHVLKANNFAELADSFSAKATAWKNNAGAENFVLYKRIGEVATADAVKSFVG